MLVKHNTYTVFHVRLDAAEVILEELYFNKVLYHSIIVHHYFLPGCRKSWLRY